MVRRAVTADHLAAALGLDSYDVLHRLCDRGHSNRSAAAVLFWTLGGNQVGKAAISGWRDVIAPALRGLSGWRAPVRLWPFDGPMERLLERPGIVVAETYPGEIYSYFRGNRRAAPRRSKRRQDDRRSAAPVLVDAARHLDIDLADSLRDMIVEGFGSHRGGGLFGLINTLRGYRVPMIRMARLAAPLRVGFWARRIRPVTAEANPRIPRVICCQHALRTATAIPAPGCPPAKPRTYDRPMDTLCRDCDYRPPTAAGTWPACGSARLLHHGELRDLTIAHLDCDAFYAAIENPTGRHSETCP